VVAGNIDSRKLMEMNRDQGIAILKTVQGGYITASKKPIISG